MAIRLPNSRAVAEVAAPTPQGGYRIPVPERSGTGAAVAKIGAAANELLNGIRDAQIESEVRRNDIETALELDKARRELEADPDWENYETKFGERARAIIAEREQRLTSPRALELFRLRAEERFGQGVVNVRDLSRRKGVEGAVAGLVQQEALARQVIDDDSASEKLRAESVLSYDEMVRSMVRRGIVAADDGERMIANVGAYHRQQTEKRTVTAYVVGRADTIWRESGGDMQAALGAAARETDATKRVAIEARLGLLDQQRDETDRQGRAEAGDRIWNAVRNGRPIDKADAELAPQTALAARDYVENRARGRVGEGSAEGNRQYTNLRLWAARGDGRVFLDTDLQRYRGTLGERRFMDLSLLQEQMRDPSKAGEVGAVSATVASAMRLGRRSLEVAGYDMSNDASESDMERVAGFEADLIGRIDAFVAENSRQPTAAEQRSMVDDLLAGTGIRRGGVFGMGAKELRNTDLYVPYDEIPAAQRARIEQSLGAGASRTEVERAYAQAMAAHARGR